MAKSWIEEKAEWGEALLSSLFPGTFCVAQEWDDRIDCFIRLPDGRSVGEMVRLADFTEDRLRETAERLRLRGEGVNVSLMDEVLAPIRIVPIPDDE